MYNFHKKEAPLLGLLGSGGGLGYLAGGGASEKATGGTVFADGAYTFHAFTSTGTFEALEDLDIKFLIVGGGGAIYPDGQSSSYGGGGGGGGVVYPNSTQPITAGSYPVVVGQRMGNNNPNNPEPTTPIGSNTAGNPSTFKGYTAGGGGATGGYMGDGQNGAPGSTLDGRPGQGAGGGGGGAGGGLAPQPTAARPGGSGSYSGGNSRARNPGNIISCGGGGGAGGAGGTGATSNAGLGGVGAAIPWIPPSYGTPGPDGSARYFGGGGGGTFYPASPSKPSTAPPGGGGGAGLQSPDIVTHTSLNNTGGGTGGQTGGASGIVIIRYTT